jgi:hypothetical protein
MLYVGFKGMEVGDTFVYELWLVELAGLAVPFFAVHGEEAVT